MNDRGDLDWRQCATGELALHRVKCRHMELFAGKANEAFARLLATP